MIPDQDEWKAKISRQNMWQSCFMYRLNGQRCWSLSGKRNFCHMFCCEIMAFRSSWSGIIAVYQWDFARAYIVWVWYLWSYLCVIWDEMGFRLGWLPFCAPWGHSDFRFSCHSLTWRRFWRHCRCGLQYSYPPLWRCRCFHAQKFHRGGWWLF